MFLDASKELEGIDAELRNLPQVQGVRLQIYAGMQKWELMQDLAKKMADSDPTEIQWIISLAYATRRVESIEAARAILLEAVKNFPAEATVHYNLGCYDAQLGDPVAAMGHLARCFRINSGFRKLAMEDEDLRSLWNSIVTEADEED